MSNAISKVVLGGVVAVALSVAALGGVASTPHTASAQQGDQYICCYEGPTQTGEYVVYGYYGEPWLVREYNGGSYNGGYETYQCLGCYLPY